MANVLAIDLGASSGRVALACYDGQRFALTEIHRFENVPLQKSDGLYWDIDRLFSEILFGIKKAYIEHSFESIGIDTWGVDFALVGKDGVIEPPMHYRDARTKGVCDLVFGEVSKDEFYERTGLATMEINTVFQLRALLVKKPELTKSGASMLMMPDFLGWLFTGIKTAELSTSSTTQLLNPLTKDWDLELIKKLGLPEKWFLPIAMPGTLLGEIKPEFGLGGAKVISVAGHDTACAVVPVLEAKKGVLFISCGTWSLLGALLDEPIMTKLSDTYQLTNELGHDAKVTYLRNITGMWILQEARRQFRADGKDYSYGDFERMALSSRQFAYFIDPDDQSFMEPGDMQERIRQYCQKSGQGIPEGDGALIRCVYDSLALKYRYVANLVAKACNQEFKLINMVGGGIQSKILCETVSLVTRMPVVAGPIEATVLGNAAIQLMSLGHIKDVEEAREAISAGFPIKRYEIVGEGEKIEEVYERFLKVIGC